MSADCTIPKTEYTGPAGESKAIKAWNKQWADGVICNLSEQNIALSKDCQRLMRANEKYRRKLAKRRAQQLRRQYNPEFGFGDFSSWHNMWHSLQLRWRTSAMRLQLRFEFQNERQRNPGLRKFLTWQDCFCPIAYMAREPDDVEVAACFAPSQKLALSVTIPLSTGDRAESPAERASLGIEKAARSAKAKRSRARRLLLSRITNAGYNADYAEYQRLISGVRISPKIAEESYQHGRNLRDAANRSKARKAREEAGK